MFKERMHDFGKVSVPSKLEHTFEYLGNIPLHKNEFRTSCGCTSLEVQGCFVIASMEISGKGTKQINITHTPTNTILILKATGI